jgi:acetylornithine deacetylase/succinyl-diaminopimelate desuccinylase family protein
MKMDQDIFTLLKALIRIQTTNGNEKDLATWITAYLSKYGINSVMQDLGNNRANLVADIGDSDGPLLLLNGHLDVVPSSNDWTYDPYGGCEERGIIYGRGAVDMKAGLAAMIASVCSLVDENLQWKGGVRLVFVADEEQNNLGITQYFSSPLHNPERKTYAVIGEPTDLDVCIGHLGVERYWIHCKGVPSHSSQPDYGENAISLACACIQKLEAYHQMIHNEKTLIGAPTCSITLIEGGEKENSIPTECKFFVDRRTVLGDSKESVTKEIVTVLSELGSRNLSKIELEHVFSMKPNQILGNGQLVSYCMDAHSVLGNQSIIKGFGAGGEQGFFLSHGIETVLCGPGSLSKAHSRDECISRDELNKAYQFYKQLIYSMIIK